MTTIARWRKASHSGAEANCVELAHTLDQVRDSKNASGPTLRVDAAALVRAVQEGRISQ